MRTLRFVLGFDRGGNLRDTEHLGDLGIDGRTILKWILKETGWKDVEWINVVQDDKVAGCCECGNEPKCGEFPD